MPVLPVPSSPLPIPSSGMVCPLPCTAVNGFCCCTNAHAACALAHTANPILGGALLVWHPIALARRPIDLVTVGDGPAEHRAVVGHTCCGIARTNHPSTTRATTKATTRVQATTKATTKATWQIAINLRWTLLHIRVVGESRARGGGGARPGHSPWPKPGQESGQSPWPKVNPEAPPNHFHKKKANKTD